MPDILKSKIGIITIKVYRQIFWIGYIIVFVFALIPFKNDLHSKTISVITINFHLDQILHAVIYFLICIYFLLGEYYRFHLFENNTFIKFLVSVLLLALSSELIQLFIPWRVFNLYDMLANFSGIIPGIILIKSFKKSKETSIQEA